MSILKYIDKNSNYFLLKHEAFTLEFTEQRKCKNEHVLNIRKCLNLHKYF